MFRFASLGSGSRGNATLIQAGDQLVCIDNGYAVKELIARAEKRDIDLSKLTAICVTHEHGDHARGVGVLARKFDVPVYMTHGTYQGADYGKLDKVTLFYPHDGAVRLGDLSIEPVTVPHDAREPTQYVFEFQGKRLGILTDLGCPTPHVIERYKNLDAFLLECNHDPQMLREGPYPPSLQARVGGDYGHLRNEQAGEILSRVIHDGLQFVVAAHLSEKNNSPELAEQALRAVVTDLGDRLRILKQDEPSIWFEIH